MDLGGVECEGLEWSHVVSDGPEKRTWEQRNELRFSSKGGGFL